MSQKCPLTFVGAGRKIDNHKIIIPYAVDCLGPECAWWIEVYTTENIKTCMCAMVMIACKNSSGELVV